MRKIEGNGIRNIIHTNICIIFMILAIFILTIVYKYITLKKEIQASLQTSVNVEELYNKMCIRDRWYIKKYQKKNGKEELAKQIEILKRGMTK